MSALPFSINKRWLHRLCKGLSYYLIFTFLLSCNRNDSKSVLLKIDGSKNGTYTFHAISLGSKLFSKISISANGNEAWGIGSAGRLYHYADHQWTENSLGLSADTNVTAIYMNAALTNGWIGGNYGNLARYGAHTWQRTSFQLAGTFIPGYGRIHQCKQVSCEWQRLQQDSGKSVALFSFQAKKT
ncbi:hypothetical protein [Mucilaginibacter sp. L196]|uniref:hypothetical protein n=1 Tax=Mucilaginibacter sp. L196 TaxID=1641870 RepID=UPI00131D9111|nr:hypothetical protein [Mucilaginibacter sp. L196]